jgi:large subunit ribosomal protein L13
MKTYSASVQDVDREWILVDAEGQTLGRLATHISSILRGKHKPEFSPHMDAGDFVIVINADKIVVSGDKANQKAYYRYSGFPGGLTTTLYKNMNPIKIVEEAVWGMMNHNRLTRRQIRKLHVYIGSQHPHQAQQPKPYELLEAVN